MRHIEDCRSAAMLDFVFCLVVAFILALGGTIAAVTKQSLASLSAGLLFGMLYLWIAFLMVRPPSLTRVSPKHPQYDAMYKRARREANKYATVVGATLAAVFFVRVAFFGASATMGMALGGLGLLSVAIHGLHWKL